MAEIKDFLIGSKNPLNICRTIKHNLLFMRNNPDYFYPSGIWVFCGPQGSGKTLSAVSALKKMVSKYPKAIVVSNIDIYDIDCDVIPFEDYSQISTLSNGTNGIIFMLDEIHVLWNSLESKNISFAEMSAFCQMRKDRRVIIGTSQVYARIAKPIREQLQYIIDCRNFFGLLQVNKILDPAYCQEKDGTIDAEQIGLEIWFHTPDLYKSYDTLYKIDKIKRY